MSHAQILNLLHREANQMSGYGYGFECPHCEGSGLIGGFAGQREIYGKLDERPLTAAKRKELRAKLFDALASSGEKAARGRKKTAEQRIKAAEAIIKRQGRVVQRQPARTPQQNLAAAYDLLKDELKIEEPW